MIYLHNKKIFVDKWAKRFVLIYREAGKDEAINWAMGFLPKEAVGSVASKAKQLLGKV